MGLSGRLLALSWRERASQRTSERASAASAARDDDVLIKHQPLLTPLYRECVSAFDPRLMLTHAGDVTCHLMSGV